MTRAGAVAASLFLALGCSSSAKPGAGGVDADAPADAADAATGLDSDAGDCNLLPQLGGTVAASCAPGPAPAATGGAIADGTYVLVDSRFFGVCVTSALAETLVILGGTAQSVVTTAAGETTHGSLSYQAADRTMTQTQTCPKRLQTLGQFSATPDTLIILLKNALTTRASTFMRL